MLKNWIQIAKEKGASDLHLETGTPIVVRIRGELHSILDAPTQNVLLECVRELLDSDQWQELRDKKSVDLSQTMASTRCRINVFTTVRGFGLAIRLLSSFRNNLKDCNLNPELRRFVEMKTGLVLISGPTGSGKSTTLAALIEEMNTTQRRNIVVLESPIEYFFSNRSSFIRQREIPTHSPSYEQAIIDSMRENPDVMVIGEMRTPEVMRLTLNAAETGHLVLATIHSSTSAEALSRICMSFAPEIQASIRAQLADCIGGVICQRLTYLPTHQLRLPHCEILVANHSVKSNVRSGQFSQLLTSIQSGGEDGMYSFDRYQRWMDSKKDWIRPSQATALRDEEKHRGTGISELRANQATHTTRAIPIANFSKPEVTRKQSIMKKASITTDTASDRAGDGRIEIPEIDEDLEELAKKIPGSE